MQLPVRAEQSTRPYHSPSGPLRHPLPFCTLSPFLTSSSVHTAGQESQPTAQGGAVKPHADHMAGLEGAPHLCKRGFLALQVRKQPGCSQRLAGTPQRSTEVTVNACHGGRVVHELCVPEVGYVESRWVLSTSCLLLPAPHPAFFKPHLC